MFIGGFRHEPNADGVRWLRQAIWPLIRATLPARQSQRVRRLPHARDHGVPRIPRLGFEVRGPAENQFETLAAHLINRAPLRFGAGLKGKIADGWWSGTPCASTSIGAEGMTLDGGHCQQGWHSWLKQH